MELETGPHETLLVHALGLAGQQGHELLDFSHAVPHLGQVAALRKDWRAKARAHWRPHQRRLRLQGQVAQVMVAVRDLCRGRHSKARRPPLDSFMKPQRRRAYAQLMAMPLPMGRGASDSAGRRVSTLRLKGASLLWCRASAEARLLWRSYYKAGRWKRLRQMATSPLAVLEA